MAAKSSAKSSTSRVTGAPSVRRTGKKTASVPTADSALDASDASNVLDGSDMMEGSDPSDGNPGTDASDASDALESGAKKPKGSKRKIPAAAPSRTSSNSNSGSMSLDRPLTFEERWASLTERLARATPAFQRAYRASLDMSWIYHDSALEGSVYTPVELRSAMEMSSPLSSPSGTATSMTRTSESGGGTSGTGGMSDSGMSFAPAPAIGLGDDSSSQPICAEIRRHREALDFIRDFATHKRLPITIDVVKKIYLILHPDEGDIKTVKYRKDIPQHRLYFHEYAPPDKISTKVRQIIDWTNDPETRRTRSAVRIAGRAHYDLLRVFPFATDSGKVARLFMNLVLLRNGLPPAILHSTERQRYYEALKGANAVMTQLVQESIENNLASVEKLLDAHESKGYAV